MVRYAVETAKSALSDYERLKQALGGLLKKNIIRVTALRYKADYTDINSSSKASKVWRVSDHKERLSISQSREVTRNDVYAP